MSAHIGFSFIFCLGSFVRNVLLQIRFKCLDFAQKCCQNVGNAISETQFSNIFRGETRRRRSHRFCPPMLACFSGSFSGRWMNMNNWVKRWESFHSIVHVHPPPTKTPTYSASRLRLVYWLTLKLANDLGPVYTRPDECLSGWKFVRIVTFTRFR